MSPDDPDPLRPADGDPDPIDPLDPLDPLDPPIVEFDRDEDERPRRAVPTWWFVAAAAVIAVAGMVFGVLVFNASAPHAARGAASAAGAARQFVAALNAGDQQAAAAIACDTFIDGARSAARSGEQGIVFALATVVADDKTSAVAKITERLTLPGGRTQTHPANVGVLRSNGRWLICGLAA